MAEAPIKKIVDYSISLALATLRKWNRPLAPLQNKVSNLRKGDFLRLTLSFSLDNKDELVVTGIKWGEEEEKLQPEVTNSLHSHTNIPRDVEEVAFTIPSFPRTLNAKLATEMLAMWNWKQPTNLHTEVFAEESRNLSCYNSVLLMHWLTLIPLSILQCNYYIQCPSFPRIITTQMFVKELDIVCSSPIHIDMYACLVPNCPTIIKIGEKTIPTLDKLFVRPSRCVYDNSSRDSLGIGIFYASSAFPITWSIEDKPIRTESKQKWQEIAEYLFKEDKNDDLILFVDLRHENEADALRSLYKIKMPFHISLYSS